MKTLRDVLDWVLQMYDKPLELDENRQKCRQSRKCLGDHLQTDVTKNDKIGEAQDKIDKILYVEDNKKNYRDSWWDFLTEPENLSDIVAGLNGYTTIRSSNGCFTRSRPDH